MKVLIADDDRTSRALLHGAVLKLGHEVHEAAGGAEAWEALKTVPARIIVSDWVMPGMDGLELCRRVRGEPAAPYRYFILMTGRMLGDAHHAKAIEAGVDDYLVKPVDLESLRMRLLVASRIVALNERVRTLEGILPMCAYCRRIRVEGGSYQSLEDFVSDKTPAQFSHGVCPECAARHFPD